MSGRALPFAIGLALRYLRSTRKDAFVSFLSLVAAAGIGLGVAALVLALAALTGMQAALRSEILSRTPALAVTPADSAASADVRARLEAEPAVLAVQETLAGRAWIVASGRAVAVTLTGYEGGLPPGFPEPSASGPGLFLGHDEAARLALGPGSVVTLASPLPTLTPFGLAPRTVTTTLAGTFSSGRAETTARAALPLESARRLFGANRPTRLLVTMASLDDALDLADRLRTELPGGSRVESWRDLNRPLFFALRLEKSVMFVAVSLIVVVAALALVADLSLIAANKRRELGLLTAMGASARQLRRAFFWLGAILGGCGALGGAAAGAAAAWWLDRTKALRMPSDVYFLDYLPFSIPLPDLTLVIIVTLGLALACAVFGADRATRFEAAEALKR